MKKTTLFIANILLFISIAFNSFAQWQTNAKGINYNNENVGIGTLYPSSILEISSNKSKFIKLERTGVAKKSHVGYGSAHGGGIYLGTDDSQYSLWIQQDGAVGIGTYNPDPNFLLSVNGKIKAKETQVTLDNWADFVFAPNYKLKTLAEVEQFIKTNGYLPDILSEAEVRANGVSVGGINSKLLQKIEELTLYIIEQEKENKLQKNELTNYKKNLN